MSKNFTIKTLLLGSVAVASLGLSGGCGDDAVPPPGTSVKEDVQKTNDRQKFIEDQYKNQKPTPPKS